jgi:DNA-binding transcriptional ArsR family regulator
MNKSTSKSRAGKPPPAAPASAQAAPRVRSANSADPAQPGWTFLSNHTHVLVALSQDSDLTLRDIARRVGITERGVIRIVDELEAAGVLSREREGRRNRYRLNSEAHLRHPLEQHCRIGELLALVAQQKPD